MGGGGLMQLVAYGAQDMYITGNPQITFFKVIYRRHTNFALESVEQTFNGDAYFGKRITCTVSRNGDLINRAYLRFVLPSVTVTAPTSDNTKYGFRWLNWPGHALIKTVEFEIGGQRLDKHYAAWLHIWHELTQTAGHAIGYANMVGNTPDLTEVTSVEYGGDEATVPSRVLYIPLQFFWNTNAGLALPLIALQYHEVKINFELEELRNLCWVGKSTKTGGEWSAWSNQDISSVKFGNPTSASLFIDYCYLDTDERRRFAQLSHEYLISQLQYSGDESISGVTNKIKLALNHPVKELIWVVQPDDNVDDAATAAVGGKQWFNFTDALDTSIAKNSLFSWSPGSGGGADYLSLRNSVSGDNPVKSAKLQLNGHDRMSERDGRYYNLVQPYQHHTNVPSMGINVYSFALKPEEHQPSGTVNMSRIDNATLMLTLTDNTVRHNGVARNAKVKVFAVNYNVLRIMSGMGGLAYSN